MPNGRSVLKNYSQHRKVVLGRLTAALLIVFAITVVSLMMPGRAAHHGLSKVVPQSAQAGTAKTNSFDVELQKAPAAKPLEYQKGKKYVALTFDDGPSIYTKRVVHILHENNARATFFVVGAQVKSGKDTLKLSRKLGDQIASHTYRHRYFPSKSTSVLKKDIRKTRGVIKKYVGVSPRYVRLPYGATNKRINKQLKKMHIRKVFWTHDTRDWSRPGAKKILNRATKNVKNGSIILMHDGGGNREQTLKALPKIIKRLKRQGYVLCTVDDLYRFGIIK